MKYRIRVSNFILERIKKSAFPDALRIARQFFPSTLELQGQPHYASDPLQEEDADIHPLPYLIHKYPSKLLLLTTDLCPIYCRYCTRKRKTITIHDKATKINLTDFTHLKKIKKYIRANLKINEVIFSGGDPFVLSNQILLILSEAILREKTISFLRYHTRAATSIPHRFSTEFFDTFKGIKTKYPSKVIAFVFHINHYSELSKESSEIFKKLDDMGYPLFSQSVLLRRINDDADTLSHLFKELMRNHIQPYYLHQLDKVEGASHFNVSIQKGKKIMEELKQMIPPYMFPKYVRDSKKGKELII